MTNNKTLQIVEFIQAYRLMEKGSDTYARSIIAKLSEQHQHGHLFAAWKGKERNFADWFLNLDVSTQGEIIRIFGQGIDDTTIDKYNELKEKDPISALWLNPPPLIHRYRELLKFFYNHGINEEPAVGITLVNLPEDSKRYGNSENWGEYILSLSLVQQTFVLEQILGYILQNA